QAINFGIYYKMRFEWNDNKAESNALKHGITFKEAVTIFADAYLLFTEDSQHSQGEEREWAIGEAENGSIIVVVFTMRGEQIRIISARKATKRECQLYESGI
ncbi:MAG: BrnT family toxin, partial [Nostoc sp.]